MRGARSTGRVLVGVVTAVLVMLGLAGPAHAADWPDRWDMSTCATEGAPSPVIDVAPSPGPGAYTVIYRLDGQDYDQYRGFPGGEEREVTLKPIRPGSHELSQAVPDGTYAVQGTIDAPACPDGSPEPSDNAYPQQPASQIGVSTRTECHPDGEDVVALVLTLSNSGGDGGVRVQVGDEDMGQWDGVGVDAGQTEEHWVYLGPDERRVTVYDDAGEEIYATTVETDCSPEPTAEPSDPTGEPTSDATGTPSAQPSPSADEATVVVSTGPATPVVVQTDDAARGSATWLLALPLLLLAPALALALRARPAAARGRRRHGVEVQS